MENDRPDGGTEAERARAYGIRCAVEALYILWERQGRRSNQQYIADAAGQINRTYVCVDLPGHAPQSIEDALRWMDEGDPEDPYFEECIVQPLRVFSERLRARAARIGTEAGILYPGIEGEAARCIERAKRAEGECRGCVADAKARLWEMLEGPRDWGELEAMDHRLRKLAKEYRLKAEDARGVLRQAIVRLGELLTGEEATDDGRESASALALRCAPNDAPALREALRRMIHAEETVCTTAGRLALQRAMQEALAGESSLTAEAMSFLPACIRCPQVRTGRAIEPPCDATSRRVPDPLPLKMSVDGRAVAERLAFGARYPLGECRLSTELRLDCSALSLGACVLRPEETRSDRSLEAWTDGFFFTIADASTHDAVQEYVLLDLLVRCC